ncbi:hypothetical protein JQ824_11215 [Brachyspira hyodysenteriae]|uniref:DUF3575 domain-containing protein n=1 Tax=Brachyspira hyodysenteriae ATCC 27164 TaxID=1266923 RepID=A0A3B6VQK1_BRAHO|nr:hypothetical protein [Brachyspira hyodysenteriae]ANN62864.1 hypothetical protein BHYOB78_03000 [Brachyspira hyodysenteriae ATCC 27164]AUJ50825.1 hypothetical protein BH718_02397 [Brachyspira hyodysenteriae]KLI13441.1 hypothetical protein SU45_13050 [Brachyspira hyodysenteriae]KLI18006.1 hypothetical protein SU44_03415 [Brachyspira hyodysenteriae]KLI19740.1 hypothetical protein SU46_06550 [Brachyspira hyodysenteriae]
MFKRVIIYSLFCTILISFFSIESKLYADYPNGAAAGLFLRFSFPSQASLGVTGKIDNFPLMFSGILNIGISTKGWAWFGLSANADWWALKYRIGKAGESDAWLYFGPGAEAVAEFGNNYWNLGLGFRLPLGVSFIVDRDWEIFLQISPGLNVIAIGSDGFGTFGWYPSHTGWTFAKFFRFSGDFGFRYWF